jgi:hypothetical protein
MHAGFSFSYSPISVLLRQPLSIKKSYAGAVQIRMSYLFRNASSSPLYDYLFYARLIRV